MAIQLTYAPLNTFNDGVHVHCIWANIYRYWDNVDFSFFSEFPFFSPCVTNDPGSVYLSLSVPTLCWHKTCVCL